MQKVRIIVAITYTSLEQQINNFIKNNEVGKVISVSFTAGDSVTRTVGALVLYEAWK